MSQIDWEHHAKVYFVELSKHLNTSQGLLYQDIDEDLLSWEYKIRIFLRDTYGGISFFKEESFTARTVARGLTLFISDDYISRQLFLIENAFTVNELFDNLDYFRRDVTPPFFNGQLAENPINNIFNKVRGILEFPILGN